MDPGPKALVVFFVRISLWWQGQKLKATAKDGKMKGQGQLGGLGSMF